MYLVPKSCRTGEAELGLGDTGLDEDTTLSGIKTGIY